MGVTVHKILTGKHYNRAIECHITTLQVLSDIWWDAFFKQYPVIQEKNDSFIHDVIQPCTLDSHSDILQSLKSLNIQEKILNFDQKHDDNPMYKWVRMYMHQVMTLLQFIRSTRTSNWHNIWQAWRKCVPYFLHTIG